MSKSKLTDAQIRAAKPKARDYWLTENGGTRGQGVLCVRVTPGGSKRFYYRYAAEDGKRVRLQIGNYGDVGVWGEDATPSPLTLAKASAEALKYRMKHQKAESRDVRAFERAQILAKQHAAEAAERLRQEEEARRRREQDQAEFYTLRRLLDAYIGHLRRAGKVSANNAAVIFERNVYRAFPDLAARPAARITAKDVVAILRKLTEQGKGRTAAKLRSYMHAAFAMTLRAELDPDAPADLVRFDLVANPVAPTGTLARYNRARDRTLNAAELRAYWAALDTLPLDVAAALRLALLLGGQRPVQLLRVSVSDVDLDAGTITLFDGKGARKQPRVHTLPLLDDAHAIARRLVTQATTAKSALLFFGSGKRPMAIETLSTAVHGISQAMTEAGAATAPFQMRDIRRTCETMLSALGISTDTRAQIQSHGLGGVQARHYDRHSYAREKAAALLTWQERVRAIIGGHTSTDSKVVALRHESAMAS